MGIYKDKNKDKITYYVDYYCDGRRIRRALGSCKSQVVFE